VASLVLGNWCKWSNRHITMFNCAKNCANWCRYFKDTWAS